LGANSWRKITAQTADSGCLIADSGWLMQTNVNDVNANSGYSNILENDRMFSTRVEMLKAGLTTDYSDEHG
jgi:hypothetical protein